MTDIIWLTDTDSTNSELRRRLEVIANLSVLAAGKQMAGRGQGDHTWTSAPGENLTFSILFRYGPAAPGSPCGEKADRRESISARERLPELDCRDSELVSCITATGVLDYLESRGINAGIKLPNDIWVEGRKICGILIENAVQGRKLLYSIVGVGLNVNQTDFPPELPNPTSMALVLGKRFEDLRGELEALAGCIGRRFHMLYEPSGRDTLLRDFRSSSSPKP